MSNAHSPDLSIARGHAFRVVIAVRLHPVFGGVMGAARAPTSILRRWPFGGSFGQLSGATAVAFVTARRSLIPLEKSRVVPVHESRTIGCAWALGAPRLIRGPERRPEISIPSGRTWPESIGDVDVMSCQRRAARSSSTTCTTHDYWLVIGVDRPQTPRTAAWPPPCRSVPPVNSTRGFRTAALPPRSPRFSTSDIIGRRTAEVARGRRSPGFEPGVYFVHGRREVIAVLAADGRACGS